MGVNPVGIIPVDSIGLEVALQNRGIIESGFSMSIAEPHAGKTTFSHVLGNFFVRAGGDVLLVENDDAFDEIYLSRFYDFNPTTEHERVIEPLLYFKTALADRLGLKEKPKKKDQDEDDGINPALKKKLFNQLAYVTRILLRGRLDGSDIEDEVLFLAQCAYRMRYVLREGSAKSSEDMEAFIGKVIKTKKATDPKASRTTLIIVDPISNFMPEELIKQEDSASGRRMAISLYMHQWFRRWTRPLAEARIHVHFCCKKTGNIEDPYKFYSELEKLATIAGGSQKLAASFLFYFEKRRDVLKPKVEEEALVENLPRFVEGRMKVPKKKFQGGSAMPKDYHSGYWLFTERKFTKMDFDLPFMMQVFDMNLFDIKYADGFALIPDQYLPQSMLADVTRDPKTKLPKIRKAKAVPLLLASEAWKAHIRKTLGFGHQTVGDDTPVEADSTPAPETPAVPAIA